MDEQRIQSLLNKGINEHGYLLELKLEDEIKKTKAQHEWIVEAHEYPVFPDLKSKEFSKIDLVVMNTSAYEKGHALIECKRHLPQYSTWGFLSRENCNGYLKLQNIGKDPREKKELDYYESISEFLFQDLNEVKKAWAGFCIKTNENDGKISATKEIEDALFQSFCQVEGFKKQEFERTQHFFNPFLKFNIIYPIIVTTAPLYVNCDGSEKINLKTGTFESDGNWEKVDWLIYQYVINSNFSPVYSANVRTQKYYQLIDIPIVNSTKLVDFLKILNQGILYRNHAIKSWEEKNTKKMVKGFFLQLRERYLKK